CKSTWHVEQIGRQSSSTSKPFAPLHLLPRLREDCGFLCRPFCALWCRPSHRHCLRSRVPGLINAQLATSWQGQPGDQTPSLVLDRQAGDHVLLHLGHKGFDVCAHEIEFLRTVFFRWMHGDFCWRQSEDEPTVAYVDVRQLQSVAQKGAVSLRILAVYDRMRSDNHVCPRPQISGCCCQTPNHH